MEGKELLIVDLQLKPESEERDKLINLVKRGYFSDFASPLATPVLILHSKLLELGYKDLADKTLKGNYDHDE